MKTVFIDTNIFLQCRDVKNLPWADLFGSDEAIEILVSAPVRKEIDNFKGQGNGRRSKRAKTTSSLFRKVINNKAPLEIASGVTLGFTSKKELASVPVDSTLDPQKNDDQIISEILAYQKLHSDKAILLLTNDTNLTINAGDYGIDCIDIPEEWLLKPEPDETSKKIKRLQEQINDLLKNSPEFVIHTSPDVLALTIQVFKPLTTSEIDGVLDPILARVKKETELDNNQYRYLAAVFQAPQEAELIRYHNEALPKWKLEAQKCLEKHHLELNRLLNYVEVTFSISNVGSVPAENMSIRVEVSENFILHDEPEDDEENGLFFLPKLPEKPSHRIYGMIDALSKPFSTASHEILLSIPPRHRDRHRVYWEHLSDGGNYSAREATCEEFKHKMGAHSFPFRISVRPGAQPSGGKITFTVSAKNLPEPKKIELVIKTNYLAGDTLNEAYRFQPQS